MREKFSLFSLFSGAGGLDLGFKLSGEYDTIFANDILVQATETYSKNFGVRSINVSPETDNLPIVYNGDVANLKINDLEGLSPDVVVGGPPCQDFSVVRGIQEERKGIEVSRGRLYSYFIRALIHLQPKVFVFENVPGLKSTNNGEAYRLILDDFSNLNLRWPEIRSVIGNDAQVHPKDYEIMYEGIVNASKLGVPQARRRIIVIGIRKDVVASLWWKIETIKKKIANSLEGKAQLLSKYPITSLEVFEGKTLPELGNEYERIMKTYEDVAKEVEIKEIKSDRAIVWKETVWKKLTFDIIKDYLLVNRIDRVDDEIEEAFAEHRRILQELGYNRPLAGLQLDDKSNEISDRSKERARTDRSKDVLERMKHIPPDENHEFIRGTEWEVEGKGISLIYRRLHPLKPSYTVVAYGGGGTWGYHYKRERAMLTNRERARLQTFPDNFLFEGNISEVRAQIGEALPPLVAKRIAQIIGEILKQVD
jgi:DNA (cytosine-5)-methyltransferase 1